MTKRPAVERKKRRKLEPAPRPPKDKPALRDMRPQPVPRGRYITKDMAK